MNQRKNALILAGCASFLVANNLLAANPHPKSVTKIQMATEPLINLGGEAGGGISSSNPAPKSVKPKAPSAVEMKAHTAPKKMMPTTLPAVSAKKMPPAEWQYAGDAGPNNWGNLSNDYALCKQGKNQSPINLKPSLAVGTTRLAGFDVFYRDAALKIKNTGKTLQVDYPVGSYINVGEKRYELMQFNFHTPSEHTYNGVNYPMEVQLVHKDSDGNKAVIAIIFQEGAENPLLDEMVVYLPEEKSGHEVYKEVMVNPSRFFPEQKTFYKYSGSLTTPPCSEGVYWMVFMNPVEASADQITYMQKIMGENARPVQKLFSRSLLKSYHDKDPQEGMYEFY